MNNAITILSIAAALYILSRIKVDVPDKSEPEDNSIPDFGEQQCPNCGALMRKEHDSSGDVRYYCTKKGMFNFSCPMFVYYHKINGKWQRNVMPHI